jgi:hypothetical protein
MPNGLRANPQQAGWIGRLGCGHRGVLSFDLDLAVSKDLYDGRLLLHDTPNIRPVVHHVGGRNRPPADIWAIPPGGARGVPVVDPLDVGDIAVSRLR